MGRLIFFLFLMSLNLGCDFQEKSNLDKKQKEKESNLNITYERFYGPRLIEEGWDGNRRYERYDNNDSVLEYERIYINGVLDSSTEFYSTGELWFQTEYKEGLRHGKHICYNEDKTIKYIQFYENGVLVSDL